MKRFIMISFALLLVLAFLSTACAEGIQSEQVDVPIEEACVSLFSEPVDELGEIELPVPEADDPSAETASSDEAFAVEAAPLDVDDTDAGEQAVMASDNSYKHDMGTVYVEYNAADAFTITNEKYTPADKYHHYHLYTYKIKGQQKISAVCSSCGKSLYTSTVSGEINIKEKGFCSYMYSFFEGVKKCSVCNQAAAKCEHKKYHEVKGGYKRYENIDNKYHIVTAYTPTNEYGSKSYFVQCDTCGEMGFWSISGVNKYLTWESEAEGFNYSYEPECKVSHDIEAHTFSNGICSKCGLVKSSSSKATTVKLNTDHVSLGEKETFTLIATVKPTGKAKSLRYKSSNAKVAAVDAKTGKITARAVGKAVVNATIGSKTLATCKVTVKKATKKVTLNKNQVTLARGKTFQLKAALTKGTYTRKLTWTSSNKQVAKVDSKGKITAVGKGTATITVKTAGGVKATCKVTVNGSKKRLELSQFLGLKFYQVAEKLGFEWTNGRINYGGSIGSDCVDIIEIYSDPQNEYSLFGIYLGMKRSEAERYLVSHGWKNNGYGGYELNDGTNYEYLEFSTSGDGTVTRITT